MRVKVGHLGGYQESHFVGAKGRQLKARLKLKKERLSQIDEWFEHSAFH
jgi:hypothetical protein